VIGSGTVRGKNCSSLAPREDIHHAERDDHTKMCDYASELHGGQCPCYGLE
jgi:hypothetical protein